jgi:Transglutaminase-like superfamily
MGRLLKFWSLTRREKQFFCEAGILLLLSNLCVKTIAFRHIEGFLRARWNDGTRGGCNCADDIELITLSLSRAANPLPWKSLCLSRSIAAFIMLRRRGIPAVMFAGVKSIKDSSLLAHAWVHTARGVIGGNSENAAFTPLLRIGPEPVDH